MNPKQLLKEVEDIRRLAGLDPLNEDSKNDLLRGIEVDATRILTEEEDVVSFTVASDVKFWAHQLSEHALFLHLGLEEEELKKQGKKLHEQWEKFRSGDQTVDKVERLLPDLRSYKQEILDRLNRGEWLGWIFPQFVVHTLRELTYLERKIAENNLTVAEEVEFWNNTNGEHAVFASHFLDPTEEKLVADTLATYEKSQKLKTVQPSLDLAKSLDKANRSVKKTKPKSVIHPALLDHVIREGDRSIITLSKLK